MPGVPALGALRQGDWKLIVGPEREASWYGMFSPNVSVPFSKFNSTPVEECLPACLYNIKVGDAPLTPTHPPCSCVGFD